MTDSQEQEQDASRRPESDESSGETVREEAEQRFEQLQRGPKLDILGEPLAIRSIKAVGIFVGVFAAVLLVTWLIIGGLGMAVGAILGGAAAVWAVKAYSDRLGRADETDPADATAARPDGG